MKRIFLIVLFSTVSLLSISMLAQHKSFKERVSLEAGAGYNIAVSPESDVSLSDFAGFRNFNLGANYAINDFVGLRFTYGNTSFQNKDDSSMGITLHKFMAEGTLNIIQLIELSPNPFEIVAHAGAGLSLSKSKLTSGIDKMGTVQVGFMPLYRISDNFSLHLDASYVLNIRQNYFYDGRQSNPDGSSTTGEYFMFNLGIGVGFAF